MIGFALGFWLFLYVIKAADALAHQPELEKKFLVHEASARTCSDIVRAAGSKRRLNKLKREFETDASRLKGINSKRSEIEIDACKVAANAIEKLLQKNIYAKGDGV